MSRKKPSLTEQWMREHPHDNPCPRDPDAARAWRRARGLENSPADTVLRAKYEAAMAEKRAAK
jgi:hypothetical protein